MHCQHCREPAAIYACIQTASSVKPPDCMPLGSCVRGSERHWRYPDNFVQNGLRCSRISTGPMCRVTIRVYDTHTRLRVGTCFATVNTCCQRGCGCNTRRHPSRRAPSANWGRRIVARHHRVSFHAPRSHHRAEKVSRLLVSVASLVVLLKGLVSACTEKASRSTYRRHN